MGKSHSTSLSYNSPTLRIKTCLRAWANAASQGFSTRLSRKRISAGLKPSRSASNCHSFPPEMPSNSLQNKSNSKLFHTSQATYFAFSEQMSPCKIPYNHYYFQCYDCCHRHCYHYYLILLQVILFSFYD